LSHLSAAEQFERFVNFSVVSSEHSDTFSVEDVSGPGDEVGIDGLAVLVNGALVTSAEQVQDLAGRNLYVEASFIFISAKRSASFREAELGNLGMAVFDFFDEANLPRTPFIEQYLEVKDAIYASGALFTRGLPRLALFYVTTGRWEEPEVVVIGLPPSRPGWKGWISSPAWAFPRSAPETSVISTSALRTQCVTSSLSLRRSRCPRFLA
jgi:hypothetical protein